MEWWANPLSSAVTSLGTGKHSVTTLTMIVNNVMKGNTCCDFVILVVTRIKLPDHFHDRPAVVFTGIQ